MTRSDVFGPIPPPYWEGKDLEQFYLITALPRMTSIMVAHLSVCSAQEQMH